MERYPLLYYSVEESMECAKMGYYSAGILTYSQLLNLFNKQTPSERHEVAHKIFIKRPSQDSYNRILEQLKQAALEQQRKEFSRIADAGIYSNKLLNNWKSIMRKLHPDIDLDSIGE